MKTRTKLVFTLVELLVVIAIIAILAALLFPSLKSAKDKVREVNCRSNIRQISIASLTYSNDFRGYFPSTNNNTKVSTTSFPTDYWHVALSARKYIDGNVPNPAVGINNGKPFRGTIWFCANEKNEKVAGGIGSWCGTHYGINEQIAGFTKAIPPDTMGMPIQRIVNPSQTFLIGGTGGFSFAGYRMTCFVGASDTGLNWQRHSNSGLSSLVAGHVEAFTLPQIKTSIIERNKWWCGGE